MRRRIHKGIRRYRRGLYWLRLLVLFGALVGSLALRCGADAEQTPTPTPTVTVTVTVHPQEVRP